MGQGPRRGGLHPGGADPVSPGLGIVTGISGWLTFEYMGGDWLEEIHEAAASLMLAIVALHIVGVIVTSRLSGQKLIRAMVSGRIMGTVISVIGLPPMYGMT